RRSHGGAARAPARAPHPAGHPPEPVLGVRLQHARHPDRRGGALSAAAPRWPDWARSRLGGHPRAHARRARNGALQRLGRDLVAPAAKVRLMASAAAWVTAVATLVAAGANVYFGRRRHAARARGAAGVQEVRIRVAAGYDPAEIEVEAGRPGRLGVPRAGGAGWPDT